jgi:hypothetical protein
MKRHWSIAYQLFAYDQNCEEKYISLSNPVKLASISFSKYASVDHIVIGPHQLVQTDNQERQQDRAVSVLINPPCGEPNNPFQNRSPAPIKDKLSVRSVRPFELLVPGEILQISDVASGQVVLFCPV